MQNICADVSYLLNQVLDGIVLLLALILNPRAERRRKKKENAEAGDLTPPDRLPIPTPTVTSAVITVGETFDASLDHGEAKPDLDDHTVDDASRDVEKMAVDGVVAIPR